MTQHPITPPPELVQQWDDEASEMFRPEYQLHLTTRAAQWGADAELEARIEELYRLWDKDHIVTLDDVLKHLRTARRPKSKPPSAVAQAEALIDCHKDGWCPNPDQWEVIRKGLAEGRRTLESILDQTSEGD